MYLPELHLIRPNALQVGGSTYECTIGRAGLAELDGKREGDLKTPRGTFSLRWCYYRPDRIALPVTGLKAIPLILTDGWCDDATHPLYNQHVTLPFDGRHEKLWRDESIYDLIIPLGYNDGLDGAAIMPNYGSAIFMHLMREDKTGTEGCIALQQPDLLELLKQVDCNTRIYI